MLKPRDLARTPTGRTVRVIEVLPDRRRLVRDVVTGDELELPERLLFPVLAAPVVGWGRVAA